MINLNNKITSTYWNQVKRCADPKDKSYKTYGGRGFKVEYSREEFGTWFLDKYPKNVPLNVLSLGRIDHSKNYSLDNLTFITKSENSKESIKRNIHNLLSRGQKINILCKKTKEVIVERLSSKVIADIFGVHKQTIYALASGKNKITKIEKLQNFLFEFYRGRERDIFRT